jgi:hypothetical protein
MVTSIFPHNGEAASADSTLEYVGSFEPTGFEPVVVQSPVNLSISRSRHTATAGYEHQTTSIRGACE